MSDPVIYSEVKYKKGLDPKTTRSGPQTKAESPEEDVVYSTVVTHKTDDTDQPDPTPSPVPADSSPKDKSEGTGRRGLLRLAVVVLCILILGAVISLSLHYSASISKTKQEPPSPSPSPSPSPTEKSDHRRQSSSAGCQSGKCADGWKSHGRQCYFFSKRRLTWTQSRDECVHMRSHLAIIQDKDEQKMLMKEIKSNMETDDDKFWIGLNDIVEENQWLWVDNTPLKTLFWMGKEPDDWKGKNNEYPRGEDCVRMGEENFDGEGVNAWVDTACEREFKFICETETC